MLWFLGAGKTFDGKSGEHKCSLLQCYYYYLNANLKKKKDY